MSVNINYINFCNLHLFLSDLDRLKLALLIEKRNENFLIMGNHLFDFGIRSSKTIRYNSSIFNNRICIDPGSHSFRSKYYQRPLETCLAGGISVPIYDTRAHLNPYSNLVLMPENNKCIDLLEFMVHKRGDLLALLNSIAGKSGVFTQELRKFDLDLSVIITTEF